MYFKLEHMLAFGPLEATLSLNIIYFFGGPVKSVAWHQMLRLEENWEKRVMLTLVVNLEEV
jgi:hypothetical protein